MDEQLTRALRTALAALRLAEPKMVLAATRERSAKRHCDYALAGEAMRSAVAYAAVNAENGA